MTYNVKNQDGNWGGRGPGVINVINQISPDIMALQELTNTSSASINGAFTANYGRYPDNDGSAVAIHYLRSRYLVESSASVTGKVQFDPPPQAGCARGFYVMAGLYDMQSNPPMAYMVVTAHLAAFDCLETRVAQAKQLRQVVANRPGGWTPIVLGDFNNKTPACVGDAAGKPIERLATPGDNFNLNPSIPMSAGCGSGTSTFNVGWNATTDDDNARWDYIFANNNLVVKDSDEMKSKWTFGGTTKSPSDHYALWARYRPNNQ